LDVLVATLIAAAILLMAMPVLLVRYGRQQQVPITDPLTTDAPSSRSWPTVVPVMSAGGLAAADDATA
jgi:hypothetical protein